MDMDIIVASLVSAVAGYVGGHLHARVASSSCMYGLCSVSGLNIEMDKKEEAIADKGLNTNKI